MSAAEDQADVDRVLGGDPSGFEGLVRRWQRPLVNLAFRFCQDRGRAEEMAQEAFLRAYRSLRTWRKDAAFSTWLFAIATNVYCSELRRVPPRPVALDDVPELAKPGAAVRDDAYRDRIVRRAVLALPAKYREALMLFYFHDMDIRAAAQSLSLPEGTIKARLSRGRAILLRKLSKLLAQPETKQKQEQER